MFESYEDDVMSEDEPDYFDSPQRYQDDEDQACDDDARLDNFLSKLQERVDEIRQGIKEDGGKV